MELLIKEDPKFCEVPPISDRAPYRVRLEDQTPCHFEFELCGGDLKGSRNGPTAICIMLTTAFVMATRRAPFL